MLRYIKLYQNNINKNILKLKFSTNISSENIKLRFRIWKDIWTYIRLKSKIIAIGGIILGSGFLWYNKDIFQPFDANAIILNAINNKSGLNEYEEIDNSALIKRPKLINDLKEIIYPTFSDHYAVIVGEIGCGKSTAIRQCIRECGDGIIYINCPAEPKLFSIKLAKTIGYETELDMKGGLRRFLSRITKKEVDFDKSKEPSATLFKIYRHLKNSAISFESKNNRPLVLVIDSVDMLAKEEPEFLKILQNMAKECADMGALRIVFAGDGTALTFLKSNSSWSRADPPYEIQEISNDEAVNYLVKYEVKKNIAEIAVNTITGGNFVSLQSFVVQHVKNNMSVDEICKQMDIALTKFMKVNHIPVNHEFFMKLVTNESIDMGTAVKIMNNETITILLNANILVEHVNNTYSFYDRHKMTFFKNIHNNVNIKK